MIYSVLPSLQEQAAIVRYLDHANRKINRYIHAKKKLIGLLNEQKQAIIHSAVTRGLDPNVKLKISGVEWIGGVPQHWEVRPLKFLVPHVTVGIVIQPAQLYVENGVPALRSLNISSGFINMDALVYISSESNARLRKSQIFRGDIVVVRTGLAGVAVVVPEELDGTNCIDLLIVRKSPRIVSEYLRMYLNSWAAKKDVEYKSVGAIQAHYNTGTLANLVIPLPPIDEQVIILEWLQHKLLGLNKTISRAESEIGLLREYRTRLVTDIVTGKLDVREAASKLPDVASEPESLDEVEDVLHDESVTEDELEEVAQAA